MLLPRASSVSRVWRHRPRLQVSSQGCVISHRSRKAGDLEYISDPEDSKQRQLVLQNCRSAALSNTIVRGKNEDICRLVEGGASVRLQCRGYECGRNRGKAWAIKWRGASKYCQPLGNPHRPQQADPPLGNTQTMMPVSITATRTKRSPVKFDTILSYFSGQLH